MGLIIDYVHPTNTKAPNVTYGGILITFEYLGRMKVLAQGFSSAAASTLLGLSAGSKIRENVSLTTDYVARSKQVF